MQDVMVTVTMRAQLNSPSSWSIKAIGVLSRHLLPGFFGREPAGSAQHDGLYASAVDAGDTTDK